MAWLGLYSFSPCFPPFAAAAQSFLASPSSWLNHQGWTFPGFFPECPPHPHHPHQWPYLDLLGGKRGEWEGKAGRPVSPILLCVYIVHGILFTAKNPLCYRHSLNYQWFHSLRIHRDKEGSSFRISLNLMVDSSGHGTTQSFPGTCISLGEAFARGGCPLWSSTYS